MDLGSLGDLPRNCTDRYIQVYTVYRLVYTSIYRYIPVYTSLYIVDTGIYQSVQSLGKSQRLSRGLKRVVKRDVSHLSALRRCESPWVTATLQ